MARGRIARHAHRKLSATEREIRPCTSRPRVPRTSSSSTTSPPSPSSSRPPCATWATRSTTAATGSAALESASATPPDLVVLDVMLPDIDGFEVCRRLRADGDFVPVIFLSARDAEDDRVTGFIRGGDDYVTKPFSLEELTLRIGALLRRVRGAAERRRRTASGTATSRWTRTATRSGAPATRCGCRRPSSGCCATCCSTPSASCPSSRSSTTSGSTTSTARTTSSRRTSATCAASSTTGRER